MKVRPSSIKTVCVGVKVAEQGVRKLNQTVKDGMTASVIGANENEHHNRRNGGSGCMHPEKIMQSAKRMYSNSQRNPKYKTTEQYKNETRHADSQRIKNVDWKCTTQSKNNRGAATVFSRKVSGQKAVAESGTKQIGTVKKVTKGFAGAGTKGAAASAGVASGAATAGISTAATAVVTGAMRIAKQAASMTQEALEVSAVSKSSSNQSPNLLPSGKGNKGSSGRMGMIAAFAAVMLLPLLPLSLVIAIFIPLSSLQSTTNGTTVNPSSLVAVAQQELAVSDENVGGAKYKSWYGMDDNWCAMFVSWCANQCGYIDSGIMPKTASVSFMKSWYEQHDQFHIKESGYEPRAGDVVIFLRGRSHTGLVVSYDSFAKVLTTIEGNTGTSGTSPYHEGSHVRQKQYPLTYDAIDGYCSPSYPIT